MIQGRIQGHETVTYLILRAHCELSDPKTRCITYNLEVRFYCLSLLLTQKIDLILFSIITDQ